VTPEALQKRMAEQDGVLAEAARYVKPGGALVYVTCSLLPPENTERIAAFLAAHSDFAPLAMRDVWSAGLPGVAPPDGALGATSLLLTPRRSETDGFFLAALKRR
jgi:16S rRNA (cytosine967-C5)-methyltransferase